MSRVQNAILGRKAYGRGTQAPMVDLQFGGHFGYSPEIAEWVSSAAYVRHDLIPMLFQAPRGFDYLPEREYWILTLKALIERHSQTIDGLNEGLEVETITNPVGAGGQVQHEYTNVTMTQSNPTHTYVEKYGIPISTYWKRYIQMLMMDEQSRAPGITNLPGAGAIPDWLPDMYTFSVLYIEPDPLKRNVVKAWLQTNMFPHLTGDMVGRMDRSAAMEGQTLNIQFGGITQVGAGVRELAQSHLSRINITNASPANRNAHIREIQANIIAARSGYVNQAENVAADSVRL